MKRRVMIAKALSHDPELLFLDEPTAGVDVELRRDMWKQIGALREAGTTIILTTHYIEEAQEMADRVGVINKGKLLLVDGKDAIMHTRREATSEPVTRSVRQIFFSFGASWSLSPSAASTGAETATASDAASKILKRIVLS